MHQRLFLLLPVLALGGCATFDDFLASLKKGKDADVVAYEDRPVLDPIAPNTFMLQDVKQTVVGTPQVVFTREEDTLSDLAREYGLGYDELLAVNPDVDPWLPGVNTPVLLPTQYVLPDVPKTGVVLNIATKRLFYYPPSTDSEPQQVLTYPIGIGRVGWETPLGVTRVVAKARDPSWWVPASVRREHAAQGNPLPSVVPPGPDNPLGTRVLKLEMPGYLIHGTNQPYGVGMRVSHGCVRLYPENIEFLYTLVDIGESVTIINEPYQLGRRDGVLYFEAHTPLEDDTLTAEERLQALLDEQVDASGRPLNTHLQSHVRSLAEVASGAPVNIVLYDANEFAARAQVVHNTVEMDPDAPTILEVREMIEEASAELEQEAL